MPRKRVWLFIVEGETDKTSIGLPLEKLIENSTIEFDIFRSDIFGKAQSWAGADHVMRVGDICNRIRKEVLEYLSGSDYLWEDLDRIVLLMDTDGSFIPSNLVIENNDIEYIKYCCDHIESQNADQVRKRNEERSSNIRKVLGRGHVTYQQRSVPVEIYFFSRNLEHALHNKSLPMSKQMKIKLARTFRSTYRDNPAGFAKFMKVVLAVPGDYKKTWSYIYEGTHSLERGSNLHLLLQDASDKHS